MTQEQLELRKERAEKEVFVITAAEEGWRVRLARNPSRFYPVLRNSAGLQCYCPGFHQHAERDPGLEGAERGTMLLLLAILFARPPLGFFLVAASLVRYHLTVLKYPRPGMTGVGNMVRKVPLVGSARCYFSHDDLLEKSAES
jgi:hypothetical protein